MTLAADTESNVDLDFIHMHTYAHTTNSDCIVKVGLQRTYLTQNLKIEAIKSKCSQTPLLPPLPVDQISFTYCPFHTVLLSYIHSGTLAFQMGQS